MTNKELLDKIKAEIERLKGIGGIVPLDNREQKTGYESALIDIEIILDSLESEKPVHADLEEAETKKDEKVPSRIYLGSKYEFIRRDIILKEIERLKKNNEVSDDSEHAPYELDVACGYDMACDDFLSFLSTLEEQAKEVHNPIFDECVANVDADVREEVERNIDRMLESPVSEGLEEEISRTYHDGSVADTSDMDHVDYENIARHFAEWQKEQDDKELSEKIAAAYQLGLADKEKQMLKEAVEGRVISNDGISFPVSNEIHRLKLMEGDKVRIIICKKEGEK